MSTFILNKRIFRKIQKYNSLSEKTGLLLYNCETSKSFCKNPCPLYDVILYRYTMGYYYFDANFTVLTTFGIMYSKQSGNPPRDIRNMLQTMKQYDMHNKLRHLYQLKHNNKDFQIYCFMKPNYALYKIGKYIDDNWNRLCM
jgi:hypothetical protein